MQPQPHLNTQARRVNMYECFHSFRRRSVDKPKNFRCLHSCLALLYSLLPLLFLFLFLLLLLLPGRLSCRLSDCFGCLLVCIKCPWLALRHDTLPPKRCLSCGCVKTLTHTSTRVYPALCVCECVWLHACTACPHSVCAPPNSAKMLASL